MNPEIPPRVAPPAGVAAAAPVPKRRSTLLYVCLVLLGVFLVICATVAITVWYIQRPIKPVVLSASEKAFCPYRGVTPLRFGTIQICRKCTPSVLD